MRKLGDKARRRFHRMPMSEGEKHRYGWTKIYLRLGVDQQYSDCRWALRKVSSWQRRESVHCLHSEPGDHFWVP